MTAAAILERLKTRWLLIVLCILFAGGAYAFFGRSGSVGPTLEIVPGDFAEQVTISGTVMPAQKVDLGFAANGRLAGAYVTVGQWVSAGTILAQIENGDLAAAVAQKQAALREAQARLATLKAGTREQELAVAQAAVGNAQAALADALQSAYTTADDAVHNKADTLFVNPRISPALSFSVTSAALKSTVESDRRAIEPMLTAWALASARLADTGAAAAVPDVRAHLAQIIAFLADANAALNQSVSDQSTTAATLSTYATTLSTARTNVNTALTAVTTDASALTTAEKNLAVLQAGSTDDAIAAQQAAVDAALADVQNAQAAFAKTRVVAPFDGVVTRMDAKVGEIVSPSTSDISMQSGGIFEIETYVPEVAIANVEPGDPATTTLDTYGPSVFFPAKVVTVDPAETVKDGVPTYKTTLAFLSSDPRIRSGMTANVSITTGTLSQAIVIPLGAIGVSAGSSYVSVVKNGKIEKRMVTTGTSPALGKIAVTSGLSAGDVILLTPAP